MKEINSALDSVDLSKIQIRPKAMEYYEKYSNKFKGFDDFKEFCIKMTCNEANMLYIKEGAIEKATYPGYKFIGAYKLNLIGVDKLFISTSVQQNNKTHLSFIAYETIKSPSFNLKDLDLSLFDKQYAAIDTSNKEYIKKMVERKFEDTMKADKVGKILKKL
jgi:hypothetical protein